MIRRLVGTWRRSRLYRSCLLAPTRVLLIRYHSVGDPTEVDRYIDPGLSVPPEVFADHLAILRERFDFRTMDEFEGTLSSRETVRGRPSVFITFDDGYRDNVEVALPLLTKAGARATFYITTAPLQTGKTFWVSELRRIVAALPHGPLEPATGETLEVGHDSKAKDVLRRRLTVRLSAMASAEREEMLDRLARAAQIPRGDGLSRSFMRPCHLRELRRAGMLIGAHTRTHPHLARLDPSHHIEEVLGARRDLEEILDEPVEHFAYPNPGGGGAVPPVARQAVAKAGFRTAVTSVPAPLPCQPDFLRIPRLGIYAGRQQALLYGLIKDVVRP